MIDIVVGYDDNDSELGHYFEQSFSHLANYCSQINDIRLSSLSGLECTEQALKDTIKSIDRSRFIFVGLLHGNDEQLLTDNDILVDVDDIDHLKGALFYSPACSTANRLGVELEREGCRGYIGCNQETYATYEAYYDIYISCENDCLKRFLYSDETLEHCFNQMLSYFDDQIALLSDQNDEILVAMELIGNRDSFVLLGNKGLKRSDLIL